MVCLFLFFSKQCIIKQLLEVVFVSIISLNLAFVSADNTYLDLDYSGHHKKTHLIIVYNVLDLPFLSFLKNFPVVTEYPTKK